jgi:hypothetical protein
MPNRATPESWSDASPGDGSLDAWLAETPYAVEDLLNALRAEPADDELAEQAHANAMAEFRRVHRVRTWRSGGSGRKFPMTWIAGAAAALIAVVIGGAATGQLPPSIQGIARVMFTTHSSSPTVAGHPGASRAGQVASSIASGGTTDGGPGSDRSVKPSAQPSIHSTPQPPPQHHSYDRHHHRRHGDGWHSRNNIQENQSQGQPQWQHTPRPVPWPALG